MAAHPRPRNAFAGLLVAVACNVDPPTSEFGLSSADPSTQGGGAVATTQPGSDTTSVSSSDGSDGVADGPSTMSGSTGSVAPTQTSTSTGDADASTAGDSTSGDDGEQAPCAPGHFVCQNLACIPSEYLCDGDNDCGDGSDEYPLHPSCSPPQCNIFFEAQCADGTCIPALFVCDGGVDCPDGSDESSETCG